MRRPALPTAVLAFACAAALPACGVGGIVAIASSGGGGGGSDGGPPPPPPTATVTVPTDPQVSNLVPFGFQLRDPQVKGTEDRPGGEFVTTSPRLVGFWILALGMFPAVAALRASSPIRTLALLAVTILAAHVGTSPMLLGSALGGLI